MIIGSVIIEDWVVPLGARTPGHARLMQEMTLLITQGISVRPD